MKKRKLINSISGLVMKKSTSHLRISITSFIFSVIILSIALILVRNQYNQIQENFVNNNNTHVVEITGRYRDNELLTASNDFIDEIRTELDKNGYAGKYDIFAVYQFKFGIDTLQTDEPVFIFGIDSVGEQYLLKDGSMEDGILYTESNVDTSEYTLLVPEVTVNEDGVNIGEESEYTLKLAHASFNHMFDIYDALNINPYFVSFNTCNKIFHYCYGENISETSLEKIKNVQPIYKVFVYAYDIKDVENIARKINHIDYLTNFVFQSFEDLGQSLDSSIIVMLILAIVITIFTIANLLLSFNNYINLLSKDIGILKQMGYTEKMIFNIYSLNFCKIFKNIAIIASFAVILISLLILGISDSVFILGYLLMLNLILALLLVAVRFILLRKKVKQDILYLLKANKAFE